MALNPDILGAAMYAAAVPFSNIPPPPNPADLEALKLAYFKALAAAIITHIQTSGTLNVTTVCGAGPGTGTGAIV